MYVYSTRVGRCWNWSKSHVDQNNGNNCNCTWTCALRIYLKNIAAFENGNFCRHGFSTASYSAFQSSVRLRGGGSCGVNGDGGGSGDGGRHGHSDQKKRAWWQKGQRPAPSLMVAFRRQNGIISLWKRASSQLEKHSPWEVSHFMLPFSYWLWLTACKRQTNAILNKIMNLFHYEII
jgi:hypothetical protein